MPQGIPRRILVTGGAGFIGSALARYLVESGHDVLNLDKLTYSGNLESLESIDDCDNYNFVRADICDAVTVRAVFEDLRPDAVIHLAAESHVDRSIDGPEEFIRTNVLGTFTLLEEARRYWSSLPADNKDKFRFLHVSTDEVFGSLGKDEFFVEETPYDPSSPYSASKAGSDHLARAWQRTYGLPVVVTNCSNNYGPYQFPEKLIPVMILNALEGKELPVYGKGENERDWLYVDDHVRALLLALEKGEPGRTYNVGGRCQKQNIEVVRTICAILDEITPDQSIGKRESLIRFVTDRPGHDERYAIDCLRVESELGWFPLESFETGIRKTVQWYLDSAEWCERVQSGAYRRERLGLGSDA